MKLIFLVLTSFTVRVHAGDIFYQSNTKIPGELQLLIAPAVSEACNYKPQWRIFESDRTHVENQSYFIVFNVEAYDIDGMHPYYRSLVVTAEKVESTFFVKDVICN